jgi:hypothetical protein
VDCEQPAEGPLSCCLPARMLAALTKPEGRGQAGDVEILLDGDLASVVVEGLSTRLATRPVEEFPAVRGDAVKEWSLVAMWPAAEIRDALSYVLPAASTDTARPHLNAVCLGPDRVAATDGHRLHTVRLPTELPEPLLLHRDAAETLRRVLDGDTVILARAGDALRIRTGSWQVETRLVDARFPPIDKVVPPRERAIKMRVETAALRRALDRVSRLTRDGALRVTVNGVLTLRTSDPDLGEAAVVVATSMRLRPLLPFRLLGLDTDNGSEFINETMLAYCRETGLEFTRSRPHRKDDQAWVEQKNGAVVRRLVGYRRLEGLDAVEELNRLYAASRLFVSFFQPSFELATKTRAGSAAPSSPGVYVGGAPRRDRLVRSRRLARPPGRRDPALRDSADGRTD